MSLSFYAPEWIGYWLEAVDHHSLQSPFAFKFQQEVIRQPVVSNNSIEKIRTSLLKNQRFIEVLDFGAGSRLNRNPKRKISYIARTSCSKKKFCSFLHKVALFNNSNSILELGTSFGIATLYLAQKKDAHVFTVEGSPEIAKIAETHFSQLGASNIRQFVAPVEMVLQDILSTLERVDLVYLDANHTEKATLHYFSQVLPFLHHESIVLVDDIHWSKDMKKAWKTLCSHPQVTMSMDLFDAGVLFFRPNHIKQHFVIEF